MVNQQAFHISEAATNLASQEQIRFQDKTTNNVLSGGPHTPTNAELDLRNLCKDETLLISHRESNATQAYDCSTRRTLVNKDRRDQRKST